MITNPVHSSPAAAQSEAALKAAPKQNEAPQQSSVPQDKVTLSPRRRPRHKPVPSRHLPPTKTTTAIANN